jgi:hypothetical protein
LPGGLGVRILDETRVIEVPDWVTDIESFRRWTDQDDFPNEYRVWWLKGEVWFDIG